MNALRLLRGVGLSCALALPSAAFANYACAGLIDQVSLNQSGVVTVTSMDSGLGTFYVCQIGATTSGIGPEQCKAMYAMLLVARSSQQRIAWTFSDSLTCTTHPTWAWLSGWYYGPTVMD